MKSYMICGVLLAGLITPCFAQNPPKPKSADEVTALKAMLNATDPDTQIAAANNVLDKFADTEFKSIALFLIASDYQRKGDFAKAVTFGERALEADPKNFQAMLVLASEYAQNTKPDDFDRDDKLTKADKYANEAIATLKDAPKPNPNMPDEQWDGAKKDLIASADQILGQTQMTRKKPEAAATLFQTALDTASQKDPATYVRLAQADNMLGKYDDAIAAAQKAMDSPDSVSAVKQLAQAERARAMQMKKGGSPAAGSASAMTSTPGATAPAAIAPSATPAPAAGSTTNPAGAPPKP